MSTPNALPDEFGANEWLVDEMYEKYLTDKNSVDKSWWSFLEQYTPKTAANTAPQSAPKTVDSTAALSGLAADAPRTDSPAPSAPQATTTTAPSDEATEEAYPHSPAVKPAVAPTPVAMPAETVVAPPAPEPSPFPAEDTKAPLRGMAKAIASNMDLSLEVPTATSVRAVPAKLLIDNRIVINNHLKRNRGGKVSFTHLLGFAIIKALKQFPSQNVSYEVIDGKPSVVTHAHVNFGLAVDVPKPDGTRALLVPNIKGAENLSFSEFWAAYDTVVKKARDNKLTPEDFAGTTISLTNPGGIGTVQSVPRLTKGQGCIIGAGALEYPAPFQGAADETLARLAVSKVITLTSTYDHRVIQGAGSGEFLKIIHQLLLGEQEFYDEIFRDLRIPYEPIRWSEDIQVNPEDEVNKVARIQELIHAYRSRGHLIADTDPLIYKQRTHPDLDVLTHGLTLWDLERYWPTGNFANQNRMPLRDILGRLRDAYCRTIGVEYMHIQDPEQRLWWRERLEDPYSKPTREEQLRILSKLNAAEAFETFLQTKFVGQKRFSLEGGESLIPLLDAILNDSADSGLDEVAIGMAHRGRLNVLTNIAGKTYAQVFREFEGTQTPGAARGSGDVKYHLGTEGHFTSEKGNPTKVYLAANPSHLEAADSVLEGIVRAKQDRLDHGGEDFPVLPILIHGDAAFAGQGVVAETLNLSQLRGYRTGGTIHVIVNNQIGFTTAPSSSRSSVYATDVAKTIQAPIFHVNGDDPEAVVRVARLAFEYRQEFGRDAVIDMICYRLRGHNEGDDPSMTQPIMYDTIQNKKSVRELYSEGLVGRGDITPDEATKAQRDFHDRLETVFAETHQAQTSSLPVIGQDGRVVTGLERPAAQQDDEINVVLNTAVSSSVIEYIGDVQATPPEGFTLHRKLAPLLEKRKKATREGGIDWGFGELLAFGSLLLEGTPVRLTGQDSRRGTFTQRHAVFHDRVNGNEWNPLTQLSESQGKFWIYDSALSEYAAMGFEYGYSVERPDALVLWEAQFGDFANGAQTIVDEFISSAEQKWGQRSSLVLLLPHGYEGQGPDHSSARIERYLQMCAEENMIVAYPSTPASHFHLLRRQAYSRPRKPLIVFTPKSMLRLKAASSPVEDFTQGSFRTVIPETDTSIDPSAVKKVLLVSGKFYYDLTSARSKAGDTSTAIIRLEQLYPLPIEEIKEAIGQYSTAEIYWTQEEPANQGAWPFIGLQLPSLLPSHSVKLFSRIASASTATGSAKRHAAEQSALLNEIFNA